MKVNDHPKYAATGSNIYIKKFVTLLPGRTRRTIDEGQLEDEGGEQHETPGYTYDLLL